MDELIDIFATLFGPLLLIALVIAIFFGIGAWIDSLPTGPVPASMQDLTEQEIAEGQTFLFVIGFGLVAGFLMFLLAAFFYWASGGND